MTGTATTAKKSGLSLGKLSAVAQMALQKPMQAPEAELELEKIYTCPQVRKTFRDLEELAESIRQNGIIEPLVVHAEDDGRYRLIVGERRFRAAPIAGLAKVPVLIKRGLTELQIRAVQVAENNDRDNLTAYDEAQGVIEDVEKFGTKEAMRIWNRSEGWISKRVATKRYAEPVLELLKTDLCGDLEVLHCLNQIFEAEDDHEEFLRFSHRLAEGLSLSRDEVRNTLARLKAWKQQQQELEKRRKEAAEAQATAPLAELDDSVDEGEEENTSSSTAPARSSKAPKEWTPEEKAAAERDQAARRLNGLREEVFQWGEANQDQFSGMKTHMATLDYDLNNQEWVLWQGFLSMTLPMLEGIGPERAMLYLKKLQGELKGKSPIQVWEALHPEVEDEGRESLPTMPDNWRF